MLLLKQQGGIYMNSKNTYKSTINLSEENKALLDRIKLDKPTSLGKIINHTMDTFLNIPDRVKAELLDFIKSRISSIEQEIRLLSPHEEFYKKVWLKVITPIVT